MSKKEEKAIRKAEKKQKKLEKQNLKKIHKELGKKAKDFGDDYKKFITKGNVVDMAVAVVVGQAFNKIVNGLVSFIITPLISRYVGGINMQDWRWVLREASTNGTEEIKEIAIQYGAFLQSIIDFLLIATGIFIALRVLRGLTGKLNEKEEAEKRAIEEVKRAEEEAQAEKARLQAEAEMLAAKEKQEAEEKAKQKFYADVQEEKELLRQIKELLANKTV